MAAFDGKLLLFGGTTRAGSISDTWTWDGSAWTELHVIGPSARSGAVMAPLGGRLFLFGGAHYDAAGNAKTLSDTWAWDGLAWTELPVAGPPARELAVMAPLAGKLFLFSGRLSGSSFKDTSDMWSWDGTAWTQLDAPGPSARDGAVMAPMGEQLVLYAGTDSSGDDLTDTWTWDGAAWSQTHVGGPVVNPEFLPQFSGREYAVMAPLDGKLVVFGGEDHGNGDLSDTWVWDGVSWTQRKVAGPRARWSAVMATP
jgi:N-acetylneuraminic acid mutarotase